jgi:hypothetical protein
MEEFIKFMMVWVALPFLILVLIGLIGSLLKTFIEDTKEYLQEKKRNSLQYKFKLLEYKVELLEQRIPRQKRNGAKRT